MGKFINYNMAKLKPLQDVANAIAKKCSEAVAGGECHTVLEYTNNAKVLFETKYGNGVIVITQYFNRVGIECYMAKTDPANHPSIGKIKNTEVADLGIIEKQIEHIAGDIAELFKTAFDNVARRAAVA